MVTWWHGRTCPSLTEGEIVEDDDGETLMLVLFNNGDLFFQSEHGGAKFQEMDGFGLFMIF